MKLALPVILMMAMLLSACNYKRDEFEQHSARQAALVPGTAPSASAPKNLSETTKANLQSGEIGSSGATGSAATKPPIIVKGTGSFAQLPSASNAATISGGGEITLNFVDADIKEVIKAILGDILQTNYDIDPNVNGRITIKTNQPLSRKELIPTLEQVLSANGVALVEQDGKYRILLVQDIKQTPLVPNGLLQGYGNQIVRLRFVPANEMIKVLEPYSPPNTVRPVPSVPNLIVITGSGPDRATLLDIISIFDVDRFRGMSFGIFPVSNTDPQTIIQELTRIFGSTTSDANLQGTVDFMPIARLNAVMAISPNPTRIDEVRGWIDKLDLSEPIDEPKLYVHYLQHGEAKHIGDVLKRIFKTESTVEQPQGVGEAPPEGTPAPAGQPSGQPPSTGAAPAAPDGTSSPDTYSPSDATGNEVPGQAGQGVLGKASRIQIIADSSNNAIFVLATPRDYKLVDAAIEHLDVTPLQVLIEATIAEVTLNNELKYGVQWFFKQGNATITLSDATSGAVAAAFPGFGFIYSTDDAKVVISALDQVTDVKVISSPQIMVLDNKTARLQVGDEVPIATQTAVSTITPNAPVVNSIEYKDTGVILTVTPRVNSSGTVGLDIEQEVSDVVATTTSDLDSPTIRQRKLKSSVTIEDGQTIALGGLIRDSQSRNTTGIPILSDIPWIGNLFKTTDNVSDRTELLILLTPHVVRNPAEAREVTDELRKRVHALAPLGQKIQ
jgi:general secretion pathway protein D